MKAGQKQLAIDNYEKSLKLNPANYNAEEKLKASEAAPARRPFPTEDRNVALASTTMIVKI